MVYSPSSFRMPDSSTKKYQRRCSQFQILFTHKLAVWNQRVSSRWSTINWGNWEAHSSSQNVYAENDEIKRRKSRKAWLIEG